MMMRCRVPLVLVVCMLLAPAAASAQSGYFPPKGEWERRAPADLGLRPEMIAEAIELALASEPNSPRDLELNHAMTFGREPFGDAIGPLKERGGPTGLIIHRGYIVAEWGEPDRVDPTFSVAKSLLSATVGLAYDRGLIRSVDDRVAPYMAPILILGDGAPPANAVGPGTGLGRQPLFEPFSGTHNGAITWDHLLRQTSGWRGTLWGKPDWADRPAQDATTWLDADRPAPGEAYEYNDVRVNLLALAALNVWRRPLPRVLKEYLMDPIGASDSWRWFGYDNSWILLDGVPVQSVSGGTHWGGGLFLNAFDQARFGLLTLHGGRWNDQTILSEEWVAMSSTPTPVQRGYGYMNWYLNYLPAGSPSSFTHVGAGNNLVFVDPEHDLVVVARWITRNGMNGVVERAIQAGARAAAD